MVNLRKLSCTFLLPCTLSGCCIWRGSQGLSTCRQESERLLADFRHERDRADRLETQNRLITNRVIELEQRLAANGNGDPSRLAQIPPQTMHTPTAPPGSAAAPSTDQPQALEVQSGPLPISPAANPLYVPPLPPMQPLPDPWQATPAKPPQG